MPAIGGLKKDSDRAITLALEAVHVPAHLAPPGSLQAKQLYHLHAQLSLGQSYHKQKKSCLFAHRIASVVSDSLQPCRLWPARLLCQGRGSPGKNTGAYWPYWLPYPSGALYFLLPQPPIPLSTWCCHGPHKPSSCATFTLNTSWGRAATGKKKKSCTYAHRVTSGSVHLFVTL